MSCVVGVGVVTLDHTIVVSDYPQEDTKYGAQSVAEAGGGNCGNVMTALSRLGLEARIVTVLGRDSRGDSLVAELVSDSVETQWIQRVEGTTSVAYVIVNAQTGSRTVIHHRDIDYDIELPCDPACLEGANLLFIDGRFVHVAESLALEATRRSIPIALELERCNLGAERFLEYADIVFVSRRFHEEYFSGAASVEQTLREIVQRGAAVAITTFGSDGALIVSADTTHFEPALSVPVKDTTGAGDIFNAGFLFAWSRKRSLSDAASFAAWLAARSCEQYGARAPLPTDAWNTYQNRS